MFDIKIVQFFPLAADKEPEKDDDDDYQEDEQVKS